MAKKKNGGKGKHLIRSAEFKLQAVQRMEAGECVSALSRELRVGRKMLYFWRDNYRKRGMMALQRRPGREQLSVAERQRQMHEDAAGQIAELERKVGRQALLIDFLQRAFKRVGDLRQNSNKVGAKASTGRSDA